MKEEERKERKRNGKKRRGQWEETCQRKKGKEMEERVGEEIK